MKYPEYLKENDCIVISAPSAGVGMYHPDYDDSLNFLKKNGFRIKETAHVRTDGRRSSDSSTRIKEINECLKDENAKLYMAATGGDFMYEIINGIDFEAIRKHPKWCIGYSDPTNLLYPLTTMCDVASFYGFNSSSFSGKGLKEELDCIEYLKGNFVSQHSFETYGFHDVYGEKEVKWLSKENRRMKGRCIGGCFEAIEKIIGTPLDHTREFIERYKDDGIVWYFDIFNMNSYNVYLTLLQFKYAGYFNHCKGILFGRVCFSSEEEDFTYENAYSLALEDIPYISEMDIGHTDPHMIMVNGAIIEVETENGKGSIRFETKE